MNSVMDVITNRCSRPIAIGVLLAAILVGLIAAPDIARAFAVGSCEPASPAPVVTEVDAKLAAHSPQPQMGPFVQTRMDEPDPFTNVRRLLCLLYKILDGCEGSYPPLMEPCCTGWLWNIDESTAEEVNTDLSIVGEKYVDDGFPPGLSQQQKDDGLEAIDDLEEIFSDVLPEGVDPTLVAWFDALMDDMRDDLD